MCPEPDDSIPGDPVHGEFVGEVHTRWIHGGKDRDMALTADFTYVDAQGKPWTAPAGYRVNGASCSGGSSARSVHLDPDARTRP